MGIAILNTRLPEEWDTTKLDTMMLDDVPSQTKLKLTQEKVDDGQGMQDQSKAANLRLAATTEAKYYPRRRQRGTIPSLVQQVASYSHRLSLTPQPMLGVYQHFKLKLMQVPTN
jgi:hypothetical protein